MLKWCAENDKILLTDNKEDWNTWRNIPYSCTEGLNTVKVSKKMTGRLALWGITVIKIVYH